MVDDEVQSASLCEKEAMYSFGTGNAEYLVDSAVATCL